jgi:hypothetical protein
MACDRGSNTVSGLAAARAGLSSLSSKAGNVAGVAVDKWAGALDTANEALLRRAAPVSNRVLRAVDRPGVAVAKVAPLLAAAAASVRFRGYLVTQPQQSPVVAVAATLRSPTELAQNRKVLNSVRQGVGALGLASAVSSSIVARATKNEDGDRTLELKQKDKVVASVAFQKAEKLTRVLNKADVIGSHILGKNLVVSDGDVVQPGQGMTTWHRGTSVVKTSRGERTITHLQSLKWPAHHYYFDRNLSDQEVAGLVSGRAKPQQLPGYAGEVHPTESLTPLWGVTKKALITNRLYWPTPQAEWSKAQKKSAMPSEPVTIRPVKSAQVGERDVRELPEAKPAR